MEVLRCVLIFAVLLLHGRHGRDNLSKVTLFMRRESGKEITASWNINSYEFSNSVFLCCQLAVTLFRRRRCDAMLMCIGHDTGNWRNGNRNCAKSRRAISVLVLRHNNNFGIQSRNNCV